MKKGLCLLLFLAVTAVAKAQYVADEIVYDKERIEEVEKFSLQQLSEEEKIEVKLALDKPISTEVKITNAEGKTVYSTKNPPHTSRMLIDTSGLSEGVYFITVNVDDGWLSKAFVKK